MNLILTIACMIIQFQQMKAPSIIFMESFDYPDGMVPSCWWSEGCTPEIKNGHLFVDADKIAPKAATIWLDLNLSGNLQIEFDVQIVSSSDKANNINCFFLYSDPDGLTLRSTAKEREGGSYNLYHKLNGYIFTFVANGEEKSRFRFRDNPDFHLLAEDYLDSNKTEENYHVRLVKLSDRIQYWIDGNKIMDIIDDKYNPLYNTGLVGFRTWHTALWWDNLIISQLK